MRKTLPLLTAASKDHPSFHVVALSLPNFGFSEAPMKKDFGGHQYAEVGLLVHWHREIRGSSPMVMSTGMQQAHAYVGIQ